MHISLAAAATAAAAADAVLLCSTLYRIIRTLCILTYNTNLTEFWDRVVIYYLVLYIFSSAFKSVRRKTEIVLERGRRRSSCPCPR